MDVTKIGKRQERAGERTGDTGRKPGESCGWVLVRVHSVFTPCSFGVVPYPFRVRSVFRVPCSVRRPCKAVRRPREDRAKPCEDCARTVQKPCESRGCVVFRVHSVLFRGHSIHVYPVFRVPCEDRAKQCGSRAKAVRVWCSVFNQHLLRVHSVLFRIHSMVIPSSVCRAPCAGSRILDSSDAAEDMRRVCVGRLHRFVSAGTGCVSSSTLCRSVLVHSI